MPNEDEDKTILPQPRFIKSPETMHRWDGTVRAVVNTAPPGPETIPSRVGVLLRVWDDSRGLRTVNVLMDSDQARDFARKVQLSADEVDEVDRGRGLLRG